MKKILSVVFLFVTSILLISCIDNNTNDKTHIVSVHNEHEELINNYFVKNGELFDEDLLETLIPKGETFTFKFWSIELDGEEFLFTTPITNNLNLYPVIEGKVEPKPTYTVTVLGTSGEEIGKYTVDQGDIFEKSMIEGHLDIENHERFDKWVDGNGSEFRFGEAVTGNITIRAKLLRDPNAEFDVTLYNGYYQTVGLNEFVDLQLRLNLQSRLKEGSKFISYGSVGWEVFKNADQDPNNSSNVWLIYDSVSRSKNSHGGNKGNWNREHVVAQSWYEKSSVSNTFKGDYHNLRASDVQVNSGRGNDRFAAGSGSYGIVTGGFYPGDEHKGDVARILMYNLVLHQGSTLGINNMVATNNPFELLLKWHEEDPVSPFEIRRNEEIYKVQKNRNPFIDYPDLVDVIWGDQIN